ncbi:hypothetical protein ACFV3R_34605 [Streptomyces sp. NPDC059740]|uniref:hypothetical protein n=1 Tax=Streptomyces sp. NPDC059740 TaxID=3346926 RepID=UPI0036547042
MKRTTKSRALATAVLGGALVLTTATSAFAADGPHYPTTGGAVSGNHGVCAYNWVQADTEGFPGWHGKHVFVSGFAPGSAATTDQKECHLHVKTHYTNKSGTSKYTYGKNRSNAAFESAMWAGYYEHVWRTDMWVTTDTGKVIPGTHLQVGARGHVYFVK